jgi:hypothetical protein
MWVVVAGYVVVTLLMQIDFFAGRNIFAKYQETATAVDALRVAEKAYYAKTSWLVLLLVLSVFGVPFALGFALSMSVYVIIMLVFFGIKLPIAIYLIGAIALLGSYFYSYFFERRSAA